MAALKSRQSQIPGGFRFVIPELNWMAPPFASFNTITDAVMQVVQKNQWLAAKNGWPKDRLGVEQWVERYQCELCKANGWVDYITESEGSSSPPKSAAPEFIARLQAVAGAVAKLEAGVETLLEWEASSWPPVPPDVSEERASLCAICPKNKMISLTSWFTVPASETIRKHLGRLHEMKLHTSSDEKLGICEACSCPLKLKVHTPFDLAVKRLTPEMINELWEHCWML